MASNKSIYEIIAKAVGFKQSEQKVKGLNNALGGLAKKAIGVAGAYFGARALLDGVKTSIDAFGKQELAEKKLEQALGRTSTALLDQASAMQQVTIFGDEAVIAQQAFLASIGMTEEQISDILPVAADLAAATGMTLESAVRNTAKTFSGLAGELGELVPQIRDLTAEEMKAGKAVEVMGELFQGVASTEARTLSGMLGRVTNEMGDMAEDIGGVLAPAIENLAFQFLKLRGATTAQDEVLKELDDTNDHIAQIQRGINAGYVDENNLRLIALQDRKAELEQKLEMFELDTSYLNLKLEERENLVGLTEGEQALASLREEIAPIQIDNQNKINLGRQKEVDIIKDSWTISRSRLAMLKVSSAMEIASNSQVAGSFAALNEAIGGSAKLTRNLTIAQAFADAYAGSVRAFRDYAAPASFVVSASVIASGLAAAANAENAYQQHMDSKSGQYGFEGVIDEPTQFTVGEGGAAEYVSVTPMEGVNNAGGGGNTIVIQGNVMTDEFVEEILAEKIADAVRRGTDFGIS